MRKLFIAGNWKMNLMLNEACELVERLKREIGSVDYADVAVCPPFIYLRDVYEIIGESKIALGAQNMYWEEGGAYTGEVSGAMLKGIGCVYVILGHSERRQYFGETNDTVNKRIKAALRSELKPIFCVGETIEERQGGVTNTVIQAQITEGLKDIRSEDMAQITIAYEPVWAIGTGMTATPEQANDVHIFIRKLLADLFDDEVAEATRIQYGGSVKPQNAKELLNESDIDGALVGGASLKAEPYIEIVRCAIGNM